MFFERRLVVPMNCYPKIRRIILLLDLKLSYWLIWILYKPYCSSTAQYISVSVSSNLFRSILRIVRDFLSVQHLTCINGAELTTFYNRIVYKLEQLKLHKLLVDVDIYFIFNFKMVHKLTKFCDCENSVGTGTRIGTHKSMPSSEVSA